MTQTKLSIRAFITAAFFTALLALLAGCSSAQQNTEPQYADEEVIRVMGDTLEKRFDIADASTGNGNGSKTKIEVSELEIDALSPYRSREFEDAKLQEAVLAYINLLEDMREVASTYDMDSYEGSKKWSELYAKRTQSLMNFVNDYGLTVDDKHAASLEEIVRKGNTNAEKSQETQAVEALVSSMVFEKQSDGYGYYKYICTAQNTSEYDFEHFSVTLALYDSDGVKADEAYASTNGWAPGEKVRFEAVSDMDASEIKVSLSGYSIKKS